MRSRRQKSMASIRKRQSEPKRNAGSSPFSHHFVNRGAMAKDRASFSDWRTGMAGLPSRIFYRIPEVAWRGLLAARRFKGPALQAIP